MRASGAGTVSVPTPRIVHCEDPGRQHPGRAQCGQEVAVGVGSGTPMEVALWEDDGDPQGLAQF